MNDVGICNLFVLVKYYIGNNNKIVQFERNMNQKCVKLYLFDHFQCSVRSLFIR